MSLDWKRTWHNIREEINCGRMGIMNIEVTESYLHVDKNGKSTAQNIKTISLTRSNVQVCVLVFAQFQPIFEICLEEMHCFIKYTLNDTLEYFWVLFLAKN